MNSFHISRKTLATSRILRYHFSYLVSHKDVSTETVKTKEGDKWDKLNLFPGLLREEDENSALLG